MRAVGLRFGVWRAAVTLPAVVGGVATVLVATGGLGVWQLPVLLVWLGLAPLFSARWAERVAVRLLLRFRPLTPREQCLLAPVLSGALGRCGLDSAGVDWWIRPGRQRNAYAAGRRSVAVTDEAVADFLAGRLPGDLLEAVLVHELGHHATRATRCGLAARWLAAPGRAAFRVVLRVVGALSGVRRVGPVSAMVAVAGGSVAVVQAVQQDRWVSMAILLALAASLLLTPPLDAALSRASEYAADRYALSVGAGAKLAQALMVLDVPGQQQHVRARLLNGHPPLAARLDRLTRAPAVLVVR